MCNENVNYKEMYLKMMRAMEKAMNILIEAQRKCEEMYISPAPKEQRPKDSSERSSSE